MDLINKTKECAIGVLPRRPLSNISSIVLHRIQVSHVGYEDTPEGLAKFFKEHPDGIKATGGKFPYHFIIEPDGRTSQCVRLLDVAPGAVGLNRIGVQVGFIGDFNKIEPTPEAWESGLQLATILHPHAKTIVGHTENPGHSADTNKLCPGRLFSMSAFRAHLRLRTSIAAVRAAGEYGLVL